MKKGQKMSDEQRLKISLSKQGKGNGRVGTKHSEETKEKMRLARVGKDYPIPDNKGRKHSDEFKQRISEFNKQRAAEGKHPLLGFQFSEESKRKMRESHLGQTLSEETKSKLSEARKGEKHWNWQGGITPVNKLVRQSRQWKDWRKKVFERDNYTCQECLATNCLLEPHHIIPVRDNKELLFTLTNGVSLCRPCHLKTIWKEEMYQDKYLAYTYSKQMD